MARLTQSTLDDELAAVRAYLVFAAHHHQSVTANQVAGATHAARSRLLDIFDELNRREHAAGHPLLGAIVVREKAPGPTPRFLTLARELRGADFDWEAERARQSR